MTNEQIGTISANILEAAGRIANSEGISLRDAVGKAFKQFLGEEKYSAFVSELYDALRAKNA